MSMFRTIFLDLKLDMALLIIPALNKWKMEMISSAEYVLTWSEICLAMNAHFDTRASIPNPRESIIINT